MGAVKRQSFDLKFTKASIQTSQEKISRIFMRVKNAKINYKSGNKENDIIVEFLIKNINIWYNFNYKLDSEPKYFTDDGSG